jgi:hypothetical protein
MSHQDWNHLCEFILCILGCKVSLVASKSHSELGCVLLGAQESKVSDCCSLVSMSCAKLLRESPPGSTRPPLPDPCGHHSTPCSSGRWKLEGKDMVEGSLQVNKTKLGTPDVGATSQIPGWNLSPWVLPNGTVSR